MRNARMLPDDQSEEHFSLSITYPFLKLMDKVCRDEKSDDEH
jgi:hypothetical protein